MADAIFSKIQLPNEDKAWYKYGIYPVKGTQAAETASWTGTIDLPNLYDGLTIAYYLPYNGKSGTNVTLNLTLLDGTTTGAIAVYETGNTRITTHYGAGSVIILTYWSAGSISVGGTATTVATWRRADYSVTNTNNAVTQNIKTDNVDRPLLMANYATGSTTTTATSANRAQNIYANASTGTITAAEIKRSDGTPVYWSDYDIPLSKEQYAALGPEKYSDDKNYYVYDENEPEDTTIIYGYHVDPEESDPSSAITYLKDAVGMTPAAMGTATFNYGSWQDAFFMPKPCMVKYDGTIDYYLNPNDYNKKLDGTASDVGNLAYNGNCMIEWPLIWYKYVPGNASGEGSFYCSNKKVDSAYNCWCNYDCDNNITQHFYTAAFNGIIYDNKMRSLSGFKLYDKVSTAYDNTATYSVGAQIFRNDRQYKCITAITTPEKFDETKWKQVPFCGNTTGTLETAAALANNSNNKQEWYIDVFADRMLINGLLILIGKSLNSQAVFGNGIQGSNQSTKNNYTTGSLNDKGLFYGSKSDNTTGVKVFGMENWWGLVWHRTAGLIASGTVYKYKLTYGTKDGSTANGYSSAGTGYKTANVTRPSTNYLSKATYGEWGYLPSETSSGSTTTNYSDYYYNGTGYARFGGSADTPAGFPGCSYLILSVGFAVANWFIAAALSLKPLAQ